MAVKFIDNSAKVKGALKDAAIKTLHEVSGELITQTVRNTPNGHWFSRQKNAWTYKVDEGKLMSVVGNPLEETLWTEFGTGEHALKGDGRNGYWVYVKDSSSGAKSMSPKSYTLEEAKRIVAMMRADGLDAHYTKGQKPKRPFFRAYTKLKPVFQKRFEEIVKGHMK